MSVWQAFFPTPKAPFRTGLGVVILAPQLLQHTPKLRGQMSDAPDDSGVDAKCRQDNTQDLKKTSIWLPVTRPERISETAHHANDHRPHQEAEICLLPSWVFFPHNEIGQCLKDIRLASLFSPPRKATLRASLPVRWKALTTPARAGKGKIRARPQESPKSCGSPCKLLATSKAWQGPGSQPGGPNDRNPLWPGRHEQG